jgi:hypothetical protein
MCSFAIGGSASQTIKKLSASEKTPGKKCKPSRAGRDSEIFPHRESPHNACSAIGHDPVSLWVQPAVVHRYRKRSSFPRSPGPGDIFAWNSHLFSQTEQYNDLSLIQANTFFKTALKYYSQLLSCGAVEHNAPTNSSDICFRDLFVG